MPSTEKHTRVVQISNISPSASREQIHHMFGYLGHIDEMKVYPSETNPLYASAQSKMCYIKYDDSNAVAAAQHMTNTVFIDRALICVPVPESRIPDEEMAMKMGGPSLPGQRQLPPNVMNQIQSFGSQQLMVTIDPTLASLGLPDYPPLPANTDATKIEEIRRTIYVGNIPKDSKPDDFLDFFNDKIGEVMYLRMAGSEDLPVRYAYIEFTNQHSVPTALQNSSIDFNGNKLRIQHSTVSIIKPRAKTQEMAKKEVEEAMKKTEAANPTVAKGMDSSEELLRRFTESRSPSRKRSRSRISDRYERKRSRTRSPSRKRSSRPRRTRSRSPVRPRSRSRERKRKSRSRSKKRSRSKDRARTNRRSRSRSETQRKPDKEKSREKEKDRKDDSRQKDRKEGDKIREIKKEPSDREMKKEPSDKETKKEPSDREIKKEPGDSRDRKSSSKINERDRKHDSSSKHRSDDKKREEKSSVEEEGRFKEPDLVESKNESGSKLSTRHYRTSSSHRKDPSSSSPQKSNEKSYRSPPPCSPSVFSKSELDTSKSTADSQIFNTSSITVASDKPSTIMSISVGAEEKTDEDSFVDELLEKVHIKKEKKKKEKKEKRKKKEKSSKRKKEVSEEEENVDSADSFEGD